MSKEFKNIDELYQAELGHVSAKAPAHVKAGIDSALGFKQKRGGLWWFILPLLAAAIIIPLAMVDWNDNETQLSQEDQTILDSSEGNTSDISNEQEDANHTSSSNNTDNSLDNSTPINETANGSSMVSDNSTSTDNSGSGSNNGTHSSEGSMTSGSNNAGGTSSSDNSGAQNGVVKSGGVNSNTGTNTADVGDNGNGITNTGSTIGGSVTGSGDSEDPGTVSDPGGITETKTTDENGTDDQAGNQDGTQDNVGNGSDEGNGDKQPTETGSSNGNSGTKNNDNAIPGDTTATADTETVDTTAETSGPDTKVPPIPEEDLTPPPPKYRPWMISAYVGGNFKKSKLLSTDDSTDTFYQNSVNDKASVGFGLSVDYRLKNGITFGSGVRYSSFKENYTYQKSQTVVVDSTSMWTVFVYDSIVDSMMNVTYLYDSTYSSTPVYGQQELFNQSGTNSNTYLHIPIRIGYQIGVGDKWKFDFMVQGRFNLLLRSTTTYVLNNQVITENNGAFTNSYLDLELGTSAHFNIWKNLYLSGTIRYRPPMNRTYYAPTIENRFQSVYLGLGVSINL